MQQFLTDADRFGDTVAAVGDWSAPTPCEEWDAAALIDHVVSTERSFLADRGAELTELSSTDPAERWAEHRVELGEVLADDDFAGSSFDGAFGPTSIAETLTTFYGLDLLVHRADLDRATGTAPDLTDDELDRIEVIADRLGSNLWEMGATAPPVEVAADADRVTRVLARLGRPPA